MADEFLVTAMPVSAEIRVYQLPCTVFSVLHQGCMPDWLTLEGLHKPGSFEQLHSLRRECPACSIRTDAMVQNHDMHHLGPGSSRVDFVIFYPHCLASL